VSRIWILGAADPEMEAIESLLRECGERVAHACVGGGERIDHALAPGVRVHPGNAYRGTCHRYVTDCGGAGDPDETWYLVECDVPAPWPERVRRIDHHRAGDAGFGREPRDFLAASSIGQVLAALGREPTDEQRLVAAADHCLAAAYRGECPGVDPDALMRWRVAGRARFQGRSDAKVLADIYAALDALERSEPLSFGDVGPHGECGGCGIKVAATEADASFDYCECPTVRDMRDREPPVAELTEAACRYGYEYVSGPLVGPDGRRKYTVSGHPATVRAWLEWAPRNGIVDTYGDPERGFAGGYARCPEGEP
jgi:hypothetical protein